MKTCFYLDSSIINICLCTFCSGYQYPELLVASYNNNEEAPHEPDGVALVWNIKFKKATPEYIFHCQVTLNLLSIFFPFIIVFLLNIFMNIDAFLHLLYPPFTLQSVSFLGHWTVGCKTKQKYNVI